jgi:hypothetical protein
MRQGARACGLRLKKARQLQLEPEFKAALEACRATWELGSVKTALSIRDNPDNTRKIGFEPLSFCVVHARVQRVVKQCRRSRWAL